MKDLLQSAMSEKRRGNFPDVCKPEDNVLLNGVFLWVEITRYGHAFVSVHMNNIVYLYTYGRYGRTGSIDSVGDGILNFFEGEDARSYYRYELYKLGARVFKINDANPVLVREYFEKMWSAAKSPVPTVLMQDSTKSRGRTIDVYDVTGNNCTTHSVEGIKYSGSKIFENQFKLHSAFGMSSPYQVSDGTDVDFTIPYSLHKFLIEKNSDFSSMAVIDMTDRFRQQYYNVGNKSVPDKGLSTVLIELGVASVSSVGHSVPVSGGTFGGLLGGSYNEK